MSWIFVKQAAPVSTPWTPDDLSALVVWLDADDTAFSNNDAVSEWTNKGSGGNTAQSDSAKRPVFKTNVLNGKPGVDFDGSNDCLQIASLALDTYISVFVVAKLTTAKPFFFEQSANANDSSGFFFYGTSSSHYVVRRGNNRNAFNGTSGWFGSAAAQAGLVIDTASANTPMGKVYKNGTVQADGSVSSNGGNSLSNSSVTDTLNIGARNNGASLPMDGDLHELIIYNEPLSQANRERVEGYLAWKWGLEDDLPNGHPYKDAPPTV